jgi:DNA-directed RNA polymerase specialized sigma24 family protein
MIAPTRATYPKVNARIRHGFAALTTIQQQALYLTVVERMPVAHAARRLDLPCDTTEQIATAARLKLYQAVAQ